MHRRSQRSLSLSTRQHRHPVDPRSLDRRRGFGDGPDGKIGTLCGAQMSPHLYIINPGGQLVCKGGIDSIPANKKEDVAKAENYVNSALSELAAGKKVSKGSTQPYGCSIKYSG